jgi:hypothetical protein
VAGSVERDRRREAHERLASELERAAGRHDATADSMVALGRDDAARAYRREAVQARERAAVERRFAAELFWRSAW